MMQKKTSLVMMIASVMLHQRADEKLLTITNKKKDLRCIYRFDEFQNTTVRSSRR